MIAASIVVEVNRFGPISANLRRKVDDALGTAALTIIATAVPLTPVDTGALRANTTIERSGDGVTVTWHQEYAAYVELGTVHMSPRPFARPGLEAAEPQFLASLRNLGL